MVAQQKFHFEKTSYSGKKEIVLKKELLRKGNCSTEMAAPEKQLLRQSIYFKEV